MKKLVILAALGVAGLVSAKNSDVKETKENVSKVDCKIDSKAKVFYHPITLTSSCGYVEIVEVTPEDDPFCFLVDAAQMEEFCDAPFYNPLPA
ncbi:MAG: hypothetical protein K0R77_1500 [Chryseobacterium sp.]|jgi:hypothetical protein|uniref:hypothetical protein n=1 Tax=Chryseobacterium sp. TaxID=1871047 RepID=UPI0026251AEE|nr:hypothetical protein [Chryseobacterium sp.]MDF2552225.1 hypothetical protein [Chryseobacterium sp.]